MNDRRRVIVDASGNDGAVVGVHLTWHGAPESPTLREVLTMLGATFAEMGVAVGVGQASKLSELGAEAERLRFIEKLTAEAEARIPAPPPVDAPSPDCPTCPVGFAEHGGPCHNCGAAIMSEHDERQAADATPGQWALYWVAEEEPQVLACSDNVFRLDEIETVLTVVPSAPGFWLWEGSARWLHGSPEYPHERDLQAWGKWRRPTEEDLRPHGCEVSL